MISFLQFLNNLMKLFFFIQDELKVDPASYIAEVHTALSSIQAAKTVEEKQSALKAYQAVLSLGR